MVTFDTRFFIELFYQKEPHQLMKFKQLARIKGKVPTVVLHELYRITIKLDGKEVADIRYTSLIRTYNIVVLTENADTI